MPGGEKLPQGTLGAKQQEDLIRKTEIVLTALLGFGDVEALAKKFLNDRPVDVVGWLNANNVRIVQPSALQALNDLHAESYWFGQATGSAKVTGDPIDWQDWKPGDAAVATTLVMNSAGFQNYVSGNSDLLDGLNNTQIDRLAVVLAALAITATQEEAVAAINSHVQQTQDSWATTVASTESRSAAMAGTLDAFSAQGVEYVDWVTSSGDPCTFCIDMEAGSPYALTDIDEPPAHPNCMCDIVPSVGKSVNATLTKAGRDAVDAALAELDKIPMVDDIHIDVPWPIVARPKLDPEVWADSEIQAVTIKELFASQKFLKKEQVAYYIANPGSVERGRRALANVYAIDNRNVIIDGHHRLAAWWLLGAEVANVWFLEE
jgi:hypothetical protein